MSNLLSTDLPTPKPGGMIATSTTGVTHQLLPLQPVNSIATAADSQMQSATAIYQEA